MAQRWAEQMARTGKLEHSPAETRHYGRQTLGENYAAFFQSELTGCEHDVVPMFLTRLLLFCLVLGEKMVRKWIKEGRRYNFGYDGRKDTENFTQLVWQSTQEIGVGRARSEDDNWSYGVVVFNPPGNIPNEYSSDVLLVPKR